MSTRGMSPARLSDLPRRWPTWLCHPQPVQHLLLGMPLQPKPKLKKRKGLEDSSTESAEAADSDPQEVMGFLDDSATWGWKLIENRIPCHEGMDLPRDGPDRPACIVHVALGTGGRGAERGLQGRAAWRFSNNGRGKVRLPHLRKQVGQDACPSLLQVVHTCLSGTVCRIQQLACHPIFVLACLLIALRRYTELNG